MSEEQGDVVASLAESILQKSAKSYLLVFYGKEVGNCHLPGNAACCIYTPPSIEILAEIFDEIHSILSSVEEDAPTATPCVRGVHFVDYTFTHLPDNIGRVFPDVNQCSFYKCHEFESFGSTVTQFPSLTSIAARDCQNLSSLSSLSDIPQQLRLQAIRINDCGLRITSESDWEEAMQALGNTDSSLVLNITSCRHLTRLPSSMKYLRGVLSCLRLESNYKLDYLPEVLGELNSMGEFQLINCPSIYSLPPSMRFLRNDCKVSITGNDALIEKMIEGTPNFNGSKLSSYYSQKIRKMDVYFRQGRIRQLKAAVRLSVLLRRARLRANHRIYRPGGAGFLRCRDNFRMMVRILNGRGPEGMDLAAALN